MGSTEEQTKHPPQSPTPSFSASNTWHSAISNPSESGRLNVEPELIDVCLDDCEHGVIWVTTRIYNSGEDALHRDFSMSVYSHTTDGESLIHTEVVALQLDTGWTTHSITFGIGSADIENASGLRVKVDDNGTGTGTIDECFELDNELQIAGPFCQ